MRVVIVGGGVIGAMHAIEARRRGHEVVQIERDRAANSASVRNFGHLLVSGRAPGEELEVAARARVRWQEIAGMIPGTGFRPVGTLNVALDAGQTAVHEEMLEREDAELRGFRLLTPAQVVTLEPSIAGTVTSGLHAVRDGRVEPRRAVHQLQAFLVEGTRYRYLPGRTIVAIDGTTVIDHVGLRHEGDLVLLCTGADHTLLPHSAPLQRCQLQMFETRPLPTTLRVSITDAGSLRYYPAFAGEAAAAMEPPDELSLRWLLQLLIVQRLDGTLTVGDTHVYDEPFSFDYCTEPESHLRSRGQAILGTKLPPVTRRWLGVYSKCLDDSRVEYREELEDGVWAVTGLGGRGMTLAPAVAERTFAELDR